MSERITANGETLSRSQALLLAEAERGKVLCTPRYPPACRLHELGMLSLVRERKGERGEDVNRRSKLGRYHLCSLVREYECSERGRAWVRAWLGPELPG